MNANQPFMFMIRMDQELLGLERVTDPLWCKFCPTNRQEYVIADKDDQDYSLDPMPETAPDMTAVLETEITYDKTNQTASDGNKTSDEVETIDENNKSTEEIKITTEENKTTKEDNRAMFNVTLSNENSISSGSSEEENTNQVDNKSTESQTSETIKEDKSTEIEEVVTVGK